MEKLSSLAADKDVKTLADLGGLDALFRSFHSDPSKGLEDDKVPDQESKYGRNELPAVKAKSIFALFVEGFEDKTLRLLSAAAILSLFLGLRENPSTGWIEGAAILSAVMIVVLVTAVNDYQKEAQFRKLNAQKENRKIKVIRSGEQKLVSIYDVVVGDVALVEMGDILPADGVVIEGHHIKCDESKLTGESDAIKKSEKDPFLLSGTQVLEGVGKMLITAVGPNSIYGKTMLSLRVESSETPLQIKLAALADQIALVGIGLATTTLVILIAKHLYLHGLEHFIPSLVKYIITSVTMLVVAVPEGLPLAVTMALAYSTTCMLKDNNLVRHLDACETMGGATAICSDKTGTLTQNRMTVVSTYLGSLPLCDIGSKPGNLKGIAEPLYTLLAEAISINSTAEMVTLEGGVKEFVGSKTEVALLNFYKQELVTLGVPEHHAIRTGRHVVNQIPFDSARKRMATTITHPSIKGSTRLHVKGASEIILDLCEKKMERDGSIKPLDKSELLKCIEGMAEKSLRTIGVAYRDSQTQADEDGETGGMILLGIFGIKDPLRVEVKDAVKQCKLAGVTVRMVTGDNIITATNIAKECGIWQEGQLSRQAIEGPEFRTLSKERLNALLPNLRVIARSSPTDKQILVKALKDKGDIVAVTGDGTNDGPALKMAHVGFAMGIAGTEVAKEASDIILMDDNFSSIIKALLWGRNVFDSIRKFLQFQLTVNFAAMVLAFIGCITSDHGESPLKPVQLLWVNLIMDTMAALALATEHPSPSLLKRTPRQDGGRLVTDEMFKNIIGQGLFQLLVNFTLLYRGPALFGVEEESAHHLTLFFNTFVMCQVFNELNARKIHGELNILEGFFSNWIFIGVLTFTLVVQYIFVQYGGEFTSTEPLSEKEWLACIFIGFLSVPIGLILRLLPTPKLFKATVEEKATYTAFKEAARKIRAETVVLSALRRSRRPSIIKAKDE